MSTGCYPKLTLEQYKRALECQRIHKETPTSAQLGKEWGISNYTIVNALRKGIKRYDYIMMKERAEKAKQNAIQRSERKEGKAQGVLTEVVREKQSIGNQARQGTKERVSRQMARVQVE